MTPVAIGQPLARAPRVVEVGLLGVQVVQGLADDLGVLAALGRVVFGELPDPGDHRGGAAVQDVQRLGGHPVLHGRVAGGVEAPGGLPQVFQHVDEAGQDDRGDAAGGGLVLDQAELVDVPVDQRDPGPLVAGVAAVGLVEDLADGDVAAGRDVAGVPAVHRPRRVLGAAGFRAHDLLRGPRQVRRQDVEHAAGLGHPLVAFLLPGPGPFGEGPHPLAGVGPRRRRASGRMATPLPSAEIASGGRPAPGPARLRAGPSSPGRSASWQNRSASAAAPAVICSSCRLPMLTPVAASTNSPACS